MVLTTRSQLIERICFFILLIINCSVLFVAKHFPTLDGPAHLYNSTIIKDLFLNNNSIYTDFFALNSQFPPNVLSHFILIIFKLFLSSSLAEKALVLLHLVFTPIFFRAIIKEYNPSQLWLSYLIFPLTHFSLLYMGFYNFTLGILLTFICLRLYLAHENTINFKKILLLFICLSLLYFSHIFVFLIVVAFFFVHVCFKLFLVFKAKKSILDFIKEKSISLLLPLLPSLTLCAIYLLNRQGNYSFKYMPTSTITWLYTNGGPLQAYGIEENLYCRLIVILLALLSLTLMVRKMRTFLTHRKLSKALNRTDVFLVMSFLLVILSYLLPDEDGFGGYITIRITLLAFLFLILWLATSFSFSKITVPLIVGITICHTILLTKKSKAICELDKAAIEINKAAQYIKDKSSVLTFVGYDNLWQIKHFGNYLGADRAILIFDNYEADAGYFPVVWKHRLPTVQLDTNSVENRCWISGVSTNKKVFPDYVLAFNARGFNCYEKNQSTIIKNYKLLYNDSLTSLYVRK